MRQKENFEKSINLVIDEIAKGVLAGDKRSIARAITIIENNVPGAQRLIALLYPYTGRAHVIGITGPSGAGKSTLIEKMIREYRRRGKTVGVIAIDPTSPFTGGAFLGDRIRMQELSTDEGVFIRSMATRNNPGGIAKATRDAVKVLDAAGKNVIIVETAGAGQSEVDIIKVAQTVVVVHAPGLGDEIQAIKAGLMEIADIFVVNKADRENVDRTVMDLQAILQLDNRSKPWKPPILKIIALTGEGVSKLLDKIEEHRQFLQEGFWQKKIWEKAQVELIEAIRDRVTSLIIEKLKREGKFEKVLKKIVDKELDPATAAEEILNQELE
jgi:LAO/AO transport system kinase